MKVFPVELIEGCKMGDGKAQRSLFDFHYNQMFNVCLRYVKDEMEVEDLLSQGFTKVFKHIHQFKYEQEHGLRAWMKKIMINECLMFLRKRHNFYLVPLTDAEELFTDELNLEEIDSQYILQQIADLPIGYKTVLNLYIVEGYSHLEIGKMLNIKEATSRSQLSKAKEALKQKLAQYKLSNYGTR
ncbi:MAG TPA: sigma-70 family RNA polymerase sigma factor [Pedobacter sp.]|nr:sigma-70 family RNA polymerase sigma factor [Pedobacter sp.]